MKPILVHLHIYYPHLYDELKNCILNITSHKVDLFVTMVEEHSEIISDIKETFPNSHIEIVENRGYDVGPFIHILNQVNLDNYDYILKLHTKSDKPKPCHLYGFDASGNKWRKELISFMNNWNQTISLIEKRKDVGMIAGANVILKSCYDKGFYVMEKVFEIAESIMQSKVDENYLFVAGTMFLIRAKLLKPIQNKFTLKDFETAQEGGETLAHIFERIFGIICCTREYKITDVDENYLWCRKINFLKHLFYRFIRFTYQKKVTNNGRITIKICKIPILIKRKTAS